MYISSVLKVLLSFMDSEWLHNVGVSLFTFPAHASLASRCVGNRLNLQTKWIRKAMGNMFSSCIHRLQQFSKRMSCLCMHTRLELRAGGCCDHSYSPAPARELGILQPSMISGVNNCQSCLSPPIPARRCGDAATGPACLASTPSGRQHWCLSVTLCPGNFSTVSCLPRWCFQINRWVLPHVISVSYSTLRFLETSSICF